LDCYRNADLGRPIRGGSAREEAMLMRSHRLLIAVMAGLLVLSACSKKEEAKTGGEGGTRACEGTALSATEIKLPSDFPIPGEAVLTTSSTAGPSQVVEGFYEADLESAYNEWKEALQGAGYAILFDEIEDKDSEISYKSKDGASTGQIALRSECEESGKTFVHITNRPA
jgi:hypothetical protein